MLIFTFFKHLSPLNSLFPSALTYIKRNMWRFVLMYVNSCLELCSVRFGCRLFSLWMPSSSAYLWDNNYMMFMCARENVCYSFIFLVLQFHLSWLLLILYIKEILFHIKWYSLSFAKIGVNSLKMPAKCLRVLNNRIKMNFFLEIFGGMENCLYFCTRFWEIQYLKRIKKEFFERFYINRQVVQEAVLDYTLLYI